MSINRLFQEHRGGATHDEISEAIRDLVAAVSDEQKGGRLVITMTVKPRGKGDGLDVGIECKSFPPKSAPGVSTFFADATNNLVRVDPRQAKLDLHDIKPAAHSALA